jgi:hypothetical protein
MEELLSMIRSSAVPPLPSNLELLSGYPLVKLDYDPSENVSKYVKNGDTVAVSVCGDATLTSPKSGSAAAASSKRPAERSVPSQPKPKAVKLGFGANIHSLGKKSSKPKPKAKSSSPASFGASSSQQQAQRRKTNITMNSEADIGTDLLAAVGGESGKKNKFLRSVFRRAVELEYDNTKAQARVVSLMSGKYSLEASQNARSLATGESSQLNVKFHKGAGNRSYFYETVDLLSLLKLKAVVGLLLADSPTQAVSHSSSAASSVTSADIVDLTADNNTDSRSDRGPIQSNSTSSPAGCANDTDGRQQRDLLRPGHMAGCSPRVFWSLVYHYGPNIPSALAQLLPDRDWGWLVEGGRGDGEGVRLKILSEKARENRRQALDAEEEKRRRNMLASAVSAAAGCSESISSGDASCGSDQALLVSADTDALTPLQPSLQYYTPPEESDCQAFLESICPNALCRFGLVRTLVDDSRDDETVGSITSGSDKPGYALVQAMAEISVNEDTNAGDDDDNDYDDDYDGDGNDELLGIVQNIKNIIRESRGGIDMRMSSSSDNESGIGGGVGFRSHHHPFITVKHMRYWIDCCKRFIILLFWHDVVLTLHGGEIPLENDDQGVLTSLGSEVSIPLRVLSMCGSVTQPRDLSLWRKNEGDFTQFIESKAKESTGSLKRGLSDALTSPLISNDAALVVVRKYFSHDPTSMSRLRRVCHMAYELRELHSWVDLSPLVCNMSTYFEFVSSLPSVATSTTSIVSLASLHFDKLSSFPLQDLLNLEKGCGTIGSSIIGTEAAGKEETEGEKWITLLQCSDAVLSSTYGLRGGLCERSEFGDVKRVVGDHEHRLGRYVHVGHLQNSGDDEDDDCMIEEDCKNESSSGNSKGRKNAGSSSSSRHNSGHDATNTRPVETGMIVAYLQATREEPMALWKVQMADGEFVDFEEHEVIEVE